MEMLDASVLHMSKKTLHESLALAEALSRANLMTSPAAKRRIAARSLELKFGSMDETSGEFIPPRQLLIYLVRMGSFSSTPKFINDDCQDNIFTLPDNLSRQELIQFCQKQHENNPMVKRAFRRASQTAKDTLDYTLKFRKLNLVSKGCSAYNSCPSSLRIFQWNVLSQALGVMNDNFVCCPMDALDWNYRRFHMVEEIVEYCPDVICLQEVDHFNFLKYILEKQGYSGVFFPKPDSPCIYIDGNNGPDGCAIFYRRDKFDLLKTESRIIEIWRVQSNQVAILMLLRIRATGQEVCVLTTHLKARTGALLSTLRNEQGKDLLNFVSAHAQGRPVIMCGDFNAEPTEPIYTTLLANPHLNLASAYATVQQSIRENTKATNTHNNTNTMEINSSDTETDRAVKTTDSSVNIDSSVNTDSSIVKTDSSIVKGDNSVKCDSSVKTDSSVMTNSYTVHTNVDNSSVDLPVNSEEEPDVKQLSVECEPAYTTWKVRDEGEICHTIDYMFYSRDKLHVEAVLEFPTGAEIGEGRIPSRAYPSDHFSLVCDFKLSE